jgi:hypothetical protein
MMNYYKEVQKYINYTLSNSRHITECYIRCSYKRCKNKKFLDPYVVMINHFIPIEIPIDCTLHIGIPMECVRQHIPVTMEIVLILPIIVHGADYIRQY